MVEALPCGTMDRVRVQEHGSTCGRVGVQGGAGRAAGAVFPYVLPPANLPGGCGPSSRSLHHKSASNGGHDSVEEEDCCAISVSQAHAPVILPRRKASCGM